MLEFTINRNLSAVGWETFASGGYQCTAEPTLESPRADAVLCTAQMVQLLIAFNVHRTPFDPSSTIPSGTISIRQNESGAAAIATTIAARMTAG